MVTAVLGPVHVHGHAQRSAVPLAARDINRSNGSRKRLVPDHCHRSLPFQMRGLKSPSHARSPAAGRLSLSAGPPEQSNVPRGRAIRTWLGGRMQQSAWSIGASP
jgi:hypothetical protein